MRADKSGRWPVAASIVDKCQGGSVVDFYNDYPVVMQQGETPHKH
jgi:hypothetical protein